MQSSVPTALCDINCGRGARVDEHSTFMEDGGGNRTEDSPACDQGKERSLLSDWILRLARHARASIVYATLDDGTGPASHLGYMR